MPVELPRLLFCEHDETSFLVMCQDSHNYVCIPAVFIVSLRPLVHDSVGLSFLLLCVFFWKPCHGDSTDED